MFDIFARTELLRPDLEDMQSRLCVLRLDLMEHKTDCRTSYC